jgi:hypothetical protein
MNVPFGLLSAVPRLTAQAAQRLSPAPHVTLTTRRTGTWTLVAGADLAVDEIPQEASGLGPKEIGDRLYFRGAIAYQRDSFSLILRNRGPASMSIDDLRLEVLKRRSPVQQHLFASPMGGALQESDVVIFRTPDRVNRAFRGERYGGYRQRGTEPMFDSGYVELKADSEAKFAIVVESLHDLIDYRLLVDYHVRRRHKTVQVVGTDAVRFTVSGAPDEPFAQAWGAGVLGQVDRALAVIDRPEWRTQLDATPMPIDDPSTSPPEVHPFFRRVDAPELRPRAE